MFRARRFAKTWRSQLEERMEERKEGTSLGVTDYDVYHDAYQSIRTNYDTFS